MPKFVRAGLIGIVAVVLVVGLALLLAQDQETLTIRSAVSAEDPRHTAYLAALVGADLSGAAATSSTPTDSSSFRRCWPPSARPAAASASRATSTTRPRRLAPSSRRPSKTPRAAASRCSSCSTPPGRARSPRRTWLGCGRPDARWRCSTPRGGTPSRSSTTGRIARSWSSTARSRSPAAPEWTTSGRATRARRRNGATPRSRCTVRWPGWSKAVSTRTTSRRAGS